MYWKSKSQFPIQDRAIFLKLLKKKSTYFQVESTLDLSVPKKESVNAISLKKVLKFV